MTDDLPCWLGEPASPVAQAVSAAAAAEQRIQRQTELAVYLEQRAGFRLVRPGCATWRLKED